MPWAPMIEKSQPPNQPSLMPPAIGVMPLAFRASHDFRSALQVVGTATPAFASTSLRKRTGNEGCTYHGAVQTFPSNVSSDAFR